MLAPLGFYMLIMVIACTTILLLSWARDTYTAETEADLSRSADLKFPVHPRARRFDVTFSATRLPERGGVRGRLFRGSTARKAAQRRLERGTRLASRFYELPDLE